MAKSAAGTQPDDAPPQKVGLYSLPISQQPGPDVSFGQNIIGKNQVQLYVIPSYTRNKREHYLDVFPSLVYGITDEASILVNLPVAVEYYSNSQRSSGMGDISIQPEYAFYSSDISLATIVGTITLPTGSTHKIPATGLGAPSYFLGGTFNQTYENWLWFASSGVWRASSHEGFRRGTQYLYQFGLGRNIHSVPDNYIFSGLVELDGDYSEKARLFTGRDPNSGGNAFYITPSLWFSTPSLILDLGITFPLIQRWNGIQNKSHYATSLVFGWTFG